VYRYYKKEFRILAFGPNKLKVQFDGVYTNAGEEYQHGICQWARPSLTATWQPSSHPITERCEITLVFLPGKLKVVQEGSDADCGSDTTSTPPGLHEGSRWQAKFEPPV